MFCKYCGKENSDDTRFCCACGKPVNDVVQESVIQTPTPSPAPVYTSAPNYNTQTNGSASEGKGFSITALVLGIVGCVSFWIPGFSVVMLVCGILGIVFGYKGRVKSALVHGKPSGLATAGFVLGIIGTSFCALGVLSYLACLGCYGCAACELANALGTL